MKGRRARDDIERRYQRLSQFFGCYLHEDWPIFHGTPENALDQAVADYPLEFRKQLRRELAMLLAEFDEDTRLRKVLNDGFGINLYFRKPAQARAFAELAGQKLTASVRPGVARLRGA